MFEDIIGQKSIKKFFKTAVKNNRLSQAYLFYGPEGTGKEAVAFEIAKSLNCKGEDNKPCNQCISCIKVNKMEHPDVDYIIPVFSKSSDEEIYLKKREKIQNPYKKVMFKGNTSISIDTIRNLKNSSIFKPFEGKKRVAIISKAEKMTLEAANSVLKLLEEPPKDLLFILTATDLGLIIPTVKSRCTGIKFPPLSKEEIRDTLVKNFKISEQEAEIISNISGGSLSKASEYLQEGIEEKKEFAEKLIEIIFLKNSKIYLDFAEELVNKRNLEFVKDVLTIINLWVRDAIYYKINNASKSDIKSEINDNANVNQLAVSLPYEHLELINSEIEKSIDLID
ncbi:MAG: DNA polymerase III subunit delta', partial [Candidatus Helarchaeota archaeon]|nr:DNA polymerase III subunit delta' [Candidatus Helarchaeota archaeon]